MFLKSLLKKETIKFISFESEVMQSTKTTKKKNIKKYIMATIKLFLITTFLANGYN